MFLVKLNMRTRIRGHRICGSESNQIVRIWIPDLILGELRDEMDVMHYLQDTWALPSG